MDELILRDAFIKSEIAFYCLDCGRRKGTKNGKYQILYEIGEAPCRSCILLDVLDHIESFPAVVRYAAGEWKRIKDKTGTVDFICSACGHFRIHNGAMVRKYLYCPNCGAKMKGEDE